MNGFEFDFVDLCKARISTAPLASRPELLRMFNQHAKWLDICKNHVPWRAAVASQNILLSSTVWRQDHNGFSHQDPGFIDLVTNKELERDTHLSTSRCQHLASGGGPVPALD